METENQHPLNQIRSFMEWNPSRKGLYNFAHDHQMCFFHEKPKEISHNDDKDQEEVNSIGCRGCYVPIDEHHPCYGCAKCQTYFHKPCAETPVEIKHPVHPLHSLILLPDLSPYLSLAVGNISKDKFIKCSGCNLPIQGKAYGCAGCSVFLHKICLQFPQQINHPTHPSHPMILNYASVGGKPQKVFWCGTCGKDHTGLNYRCESCDLNLGIQCIFPKTKTANSDEIRTGHLLTLLHEQPEGLEEDDCLLCGTMIMNLQQQPIIRCKECRFSLHCRCVFPLPHVMSMFPPTVEINKHHAHRLIFSPNLKMDTSLAYCNMCEAAIDLSTPVYYCEMCDYMAHVTCAVGTLRFSLAHKLDSVVLDIHPIVVLNPSLTLGNVIWSMEEAEKRNLFDIVKTATLSLMDVERTILGNSQQNARHEIPPTDDMKYSQEQFTWIMDKFENKCRDKRSRLRYYEAKSQLTKVNGHIVPHNLAPVFKILLSRYTDIFNAENPLMSRRGRTFIFAVLCAAIYSICCTKETELNEAQLYTCWECFKIAKSAGYGVEFAFKRLRKALNAYFGIQNSSLTDAGLDELDSEMANISVGMEALQKKCARRKTVFHPNDSESVENLETIDIVGEFEHVSSWDEYDTGIWDLNRNEDYLNAIEEATNFGEKASTSINPINKGANSDINLQSYLLQKVKIFIQEHILDKDSLKKSEADKVPEPNDCSFHSCKLTLFQGSSKKSGHVENNISSNHFRRKVLCFACDLPTQDPMYHCSKCKIFMHDSCVHLPRQIEHPLHSIHRLVLYTKSERLSKAKCSACGESCRGCVYRCQRCYFYLEVRCLFRKPTLTTQSHGMVVLLDDPVNHTKPQGCFACRKKIHVPPFLRCVPCNISLHPQCA